MQPFGLYAPTMVVDGAIISVSDYVELNGFNLAHHTTALEQSVLGKRNFEANTGLVAINPTVYGKRSRSTSDASASASSSSAADTSSRTSGSLSDHISLKSGSDSQVTACESAPSSRKSSISNASSQQLDSLATWRAQVHAENERERCAKRIRDLQGEVVRLATEVVDSASQPAMVAAPPAAAVPAAISSISPASSSSSSSEGSKMAMVDCLVDAACRTLDIVWNASSPSPHCDLAKGQGALPLQVFVRETLRRGRASCSTLQAALLYCVRLGGVVKSQSAPAAQPSSAFLGMSQEERSLLRCPRRMFLASVMVAAKFVQDRCYSNRAWSKISGLPLKDLCKLERAFLKALDYKLMVSEGEYDKWAAELKRAQPAAPVEPIAVANGRSILNRSQSDNVTGAAVAHDTELRAASPCLASQVEPKYRLLPEAEQLAPSVPADLALPFPRVGPSAVSAES